MSAQDPFLLPAVFLKNPQSRGLMYSQMGLWKAEEEIFGRQEGISALPNEAAFGYYRCGDLQGISDAIPLDEKLHRVVVTYRGKVVPAHYMAEVFLTPMGEHWNFVSMLLRKTVGLGPVPWLVSIDSNFKVEVLEVAQATSRLRT